MVNLPASDDVAWQSLGKPLAQTLLSLGRFPVLQYEAPGLLQSFSEKQKLTASRFVDHEMNLIKR
jgi:hypothetical protein